MAFDYDGGVLQPLAEIANICRQRGIWLHCDATQAVGWLPIDATRFDGVVCSAYKWFGPHQSILWARPEVIASTPSIQHKQQPDDQAQ